MISLSPLQLEKFAVHSFSMRAKEYEKHSRDSTVNPLKIELKADYFDFEDDPGKFEVRIAVSLAPDNDRVGKSETIVMACEMTVSGIFRINGRVPPEPAKILREMSAPTILYGIARGIASMMTSVSPGGPAIWPTLNLQKLHEKEASREESSTPKTPAKKRPSKKKAKVQE